MSQAEEEVAPLNDLNFTLDDLKGPLQGPFPFTSENFGAWWRLITDNKGALTYQESLSFKDEIVDHLNLFLAVSLRRRSITFINSVAKLWRRPNGCRCPRNA